MRMEVIDEKRNDESYDDVDAIIDPFLDDMPTTIASLRTGLAQIERMELALRNVLAMSAKLRKKDPELHKHLDRFCEEAGVQRSVLRGQTKYAVYIDDSHEGAFRGTGEDKT